jgi:hypothetical protein
MLSMICLVDLRLGIDVLSEIHRLEREAVAVGSDQAELLLAGKHEATERGHARLLHRMLEQDVRPARRDRRGGDEEIGAIEVDRIDCVLGNETGDVDGA